MIYCAKLDYDESVMIGRQIHFEKVFSLSPILEGKLMEDEVIKEKM
jgi:hypothetical protein